MNLEVIEGLLEGTKINVTTADSGSECISILAERSFDVIFLDQMMPGMSGVQTLEEIRSQNLAPDTPVIALTADAIVGARDNYIKEGFTDYLSKPVMYSALEAVLIKYLDPSLIKDTEGATAEEEGEKPVVIAISDSPDKLRKLKSLLGNDCKGVFVKDAESASKYLAKQEKKASE